MTDLGTSFAIASGGVLTLFIAPPPPNGSSVWVRLVDEVSGATAEAIAYDCAGLYLETDY